MLEPRRAVFYAFHDPEVPLQKEDVDYYRYHPLLLNAAFLGDLSEQDRRILGFGDKTNYIHAFQRASRHRRFQKTVAAAFHSKIVVDSFFSRVAGRLKRTFKIKS